MSVGLKGISPGWSVFAVQISTVADRESSMEFPDRSRDPIGVKEFNGGG